MRIETPLTTGPDLTSAEFERRVLKADGDLNKQYKLGALTGYTEQDMTDDGFPETVYTFASGQTLFAVTNYGASYTETTTAREWVSGTRMVLKKVYSYEAKEVGSVEVTKHVCREVTDGDAGIKDRSLNVGDYICSDETVRTPLYKVFRTEKEEPVLEEGWNGHFEEKTSATNIYCHGFNDLRSDGDLDGNKNEEVIGSVVFEDDPETKDVIEIYDVPAYTLVLEAAPPPPPPPPPAPKLIETDLRPPKPVIPGKQGG